ncbi:MAG: hypothetical protein AAF959_01095 [Cyanobacteria bacterium P01_D01_bin.56]
MMHILQRTSSSLHNGLKQLKMMMALLMLGAILGGGPGFYLGWQARNTAQPLLQTQRHIDRLIDTLFFLK